MINPPMMGPEMAPPSAAPMPPQQLPINVPVSPEEQKKIVGTCQELKRAMKNHAKEKKKIMRDAYAYAKSKFIGNDLLPLPTAEGSDNDANKNRPQVFIPKTRQQVKTLYAYLKLTLFPNDEDFFRVRSKTSMGVQLEDQLTDGLKYLFSEAMITEKLGIWVMNLVEMGNAAVLPVVNKDKSYEWALNPETQSYDAYEIDKPVSFDVDVLDPLHFYVDPNERNPDRAKWAYFGLKKKQELKDSPFYFNVGPELDKMAKKSTNDTKKEDLKTSGYTDLNNQFDDIEESVDYDLYYLPYLKCDGKEYRNMLVGIAGEELLVRFHPNLFPRGMNPAVFCTWMDDPQSPYGIGPVEDMMPLQRLINMIYNYLIELLARMGNCYAVSEQTDINSLFGAAARIITTKGDPNQAVMALNGDYAEVSALMNFIGTLAAEAQITSGAQNPFQGSSNVDFKKTATELQILQENGISINREVVEHVSVRVQQILERLMYLVADEYKAPIEIRVDDPVMGPRFIQVDFSVLRSGDFTIELVNVNPSQSKQAQVETLTRLVELIGAQPQALPLLEPVLNKISTLEGLRDGPEMLQEIIQKMQGMMGAPPQPGIPAPQAGMVPPPDPGMVPVPQAAA